MNTDMEADRTLRNLTVIARVKQHDKLVTIGDTFAISPPTYWRGIVRKWQGEHREANLQRTQETFHAACAYITAHIGAAESSSESSHDPSKLKCTRLVDALSKCVVGLENMHVTYSDDTTSCVRIQILIQNVRDFITTLPAHITRYTIRSDGFVSYDDP